MSAFSMNQMYSFRLSLLAFIRALLLNSRTDCVLNSFLLQAFYSCHSQYESNDACVVSWSGKDTVLQFNAACCFPGNLSRLSCSHQQDCKLPNFFLQFFCVLCIFQGLTLWASAPTPQRMNLGSRKLLKTVI